MSISISGLGGAGMAQTMTGASMRMPPQQKMAQLFQKMDTGSSGSIEKSQLEWAFQRLNPPASFKAMGVEAVFGRLDPSGTGRVGKDDFINGMLAMMGTSGASPTEKPSAPQEGTEGAKGSSISVSV